MCHLYVASTLVHLHCLAIRFYNDFKLLCPNNKVYGISVQWIFFFLFRANLPLLFLASAWPAMPLLIGHESFMGSWPFCLSQGILMPKISEIQSHFLQPTACLLPAALLNGCTSLGRSPEIFWHDKMDYILRLLFQIPASILSNSAT